MDRAIFLVLNLFSTFYTFYTFNYTFLLQGHCEGTYRQ